MKLPLTGPHALPGIFRATHHWPPKQHTMRQTVAAAQWECPQSYSKALAIMQIEC